MLSKIILHTSFCIVSVELDITEGLGSDTVESIKPLFVEVPAVNSWEYFLCPSEDIEFSKTNNELLDVYVILDVAELLKLEEDNFGFLSTIEELSLS